MAVTRIGCVLSLCFLFLTIGCATGISRQARSKVTFYGSFKDLQRAPDEYLGEVVLFGGKIIENQVSKASSDLTVLHLSLDWLNRPLDGDRSEGRYLVRSDQFLDPAIYKKGALLTVVGRVEGSESRVIGKFDYVHPRVEAIEIKLWPRVGRGSSSVHFGIGIGTSF